MTSPTSDSEPDEFGAFRALAESLDAEDERWAFGTGFTDPLAGVDTTIPDGVDPAALAACCLALGDDALIYSQRLTEWVSRAPELEEETALANMALDLLGQARLLLARAGRALGAAGYADPPDEDRLAFFRDEKEFRNVRLAERADGDFAELTGRLLIFSAWRLAQFTRLTRAPDPVLAAIAAKAVPELAYHRDYAARWVVRLGDGTAVSHARMQAALDLLWPYVDELFAPDPRSEALTGDQLSVTDNRTEVDGVLDAVLTTATLRRPAVLPLARLRGRAGRDGVHTEAMGYLLAEMQSVARAHPGATW